MAYNLIVTDAAKGLQKLPNKGVELASIFDIGKLGIPGNAVYVTYHPVNDWGWNGSNF